MAWEETRDKDVILDLCLAPYFKTYQRQEKLFLSM